MTFYDGRTYEFGFGYADVPGTQPLQCSKGTCTCDPDSKAFYSPPLTVRMPIPPGATPLSGTRDFTGDTSPTDRFTVSWEFTPVGKARLKAIPTVAGNVQWGDPVTLDGSKSKGKIKGYKWSFDPPASLDEPVHVLHPQRDGYTVAQVSDKGPTPGSRTCRRGRSRRSGRRCSTSGSPRTGRPS